ncbi:hypothetical protein Tco_1170251 [Tanacetum coccineum]
MQAACLKEKDDKIASLKAYLSLKEAEAAEAIRLRPQRNSTLEEEKGALESKVAALESADATKVAKLASLTAQVAKLTKDLSKLGLSCNELSIKASSLDVEKDGLVGQVSSLDGICSGLRDQVMGYKLFKEQIKVVQDEQVKMLSDKVAGIDADLMGMGLKLVVMKCLQSLEYLVALGGATSRAIDKGMQVRLAAGIDHGKAGRDLANVSVYDSSAEANFVFVVNALRTVDFPLLSQLESQKDASIADIMGLLHLEGPAAETSEVEQLQPSHEQLMLPIHHPEEDAASQRLSISEAMIPLIEPLSVENLVGEASTSGVPAMTTALSTTFVQTSSVLPISATDPRVLSVEQPTEVPKIMFEKEELDTTPEHTTTD